MKHTHTWMQGLCSWAIGCLMDTDRENTSSQLQNTGAGEFLKGSTLGIQTRDLQSALQTQPLPFL